MKYKLVCFDLDGTIIGGIEYIWKTLYEHFELDMQERKKVMDSFMNGDITYQQWVDHAVDLLVEKGVTQSDLIRVFENHVFLMPGALDTLRHLKKMGYKLAVISGSVDFILEYMLPNYDTLFDDVMINRFEFDEHGKLLRGIGTPFDMAEKAEGMRVIAKREGLKLSECVFVGDNTNDVHIAEIAGLSIAFNCKSDKLAETVDVVIEEKDMTHIIKHIT